MKISTKNTWVGKLFDMLGMNKSFHKYESVDFDGRATVISPVEAKVVRVGKIDSGGNIISKGNKKINLKLLIGEYQQKFYNGTYINFYLSPNNKHFWITPCSGYFRYTQKNEGKSIFPVLVGLENLFGVEMFSKAVKKNASIGSVFQAKNFMVAMIAVGSLNVNRIHVDYKHKMNYEKGTPCGYFSLGSSMVLCFPNCESFSVKEGDFVRMGEKII